jgi:hypothetical protein
MKNLKNCQTEISELTGVNEFLVQKFIDENNIHSSKLLAFLKINGPNKAQNISEIANLILGHASNEFKKGIIHSFSQGI